jgi:hypothetical protein
MLLCVVWYKLSYVSLVFLASIKATSQKTAKFMSMWAYGLQRHVDWYVDTSVSDKKKNTVSIFRAGGDQQ